MKKLSILLLCILANVLNTSGQEFFKYFLYNNVPLEITDINPVTSGGFIASANFTDSTIFPFYEPLLIRISSIGTIDWVKKINNPNAVITTGHITRAQEIPGVGFLVSGRACSSILSENFLIFQFDYSGNIIWKKEYETTQFYQPSFKARIINLNSGEFLFTGTNYTSENYYLRLNNQGDALWGKSYTLDTICPMSHTGDAVEINNGDIISIGQYNHFYLLKTNSGGTLKWRKTFANLVLFNESLYKSLDNKIVIAGSQQDSSNGKFNLSLTKIDTSGNVLWSKKYIPSLSESIKFDDIIQLEDSSFILACSRTSNNLYDYFPILLVHIDKTGNYLSTSKIDTTYLNGLHNTFTLKYLGNDSIILAGGPYVFKYNLLNGINCNESLYSFTDINNPINFISGYYLETNFVNPVISIYSTINVVVEQGEYCNLVGQKEDDISNTQIDLYPNPTNGILKIESKIKLEKYLLYNSDGKLTTEILKPNEYSELRVSEYAPGIYYLQIISKSSSILKKIIIF